MQEFNLDGRMTVASIKDSFRKLTGGTLRVKDGSKKADGSATLASIRMDCDNKSGSLELNPYMTVGVFKSKMLDDFGLKVEVGTPDDWVSVPDGILLGQLSELPKNATRAQLDSLVEKLIIDSQMTVSSIKDSFRKLTGGTLRVKDGNRKADESATLASINIDCDGALELDPEMTVGEFESKMLDDFGLKVEVATPDDWVSVPDGITLGQLYELPKNATRAQLDSLVGNC